MFAMTLCAIAAGGPAAVKLSDGWTLQSSCVDKAAGEQISMVGYKAEGWHKTSVPSTVVAALVADGTYPDPYFGENLRKLPGVSYKVGENFVHAPMADDSPFKCSWWFRKEFTVAHDAGKHFALRFDGIGYRANIWLNGKKIADEKDVAGTYRSYVFDVSDGVVAGKPNALAVEVFAQTEKDLGVNWVDWSPMPPDKDMGLWKDVTLLATGPVAIRDPWVASELDESYKNAALTVRADLVNMSGSAVTGTLKGSIGSIKFAQPVTIGAGETKLVALGPNEIPALTLAHPRLWWPRDFGKPELYDLKLTFEANGAVSDVAEREFGIRKVTSEITPTGRVFSVNGQKILIRGGGWSGDMMLRYSPERMRTDFEYVKDMGLNTIRLEGKLERDEFFQMADREGILVMAGWCCCDIWEEWDKWTAETKAVAEASQRTQIRRLRAHPSMLAWLNGSDNPPPAEIESMYLDVIKKELWPNPVISSATAKPTTVTGASGVKMTGPYDYVPPNYWLTDTKFGGAHGFNTETSAGVAIPTKQSMERMVGKENLWPYNSAWALHAGGLRFAKLTIYDGAMEQRYGKAADLDDYLRKSQAIAYEGERAMFEAYNRNKFASSGVVQWMLNNAWPSTIWHLYDYYHVPAGGYYGTKQACEPIHAQFSYDDQSIVVVNSTLRDAAAQLRVEVFDFNLKAVFTKTLDVASKANSSEKVLTLPELKTITPTYFVRLTLKSKGEEASSNFYWLSTKPDVLDWAKSDWAFTPQTAFADLTALNSLAPAKLTVTPVEFAGKHKMAVTVTNSGKSLAFMVHLRLTNAKGEDLVPVLWSDNYISLLPGETRTIEANVELDVIRRAKAVSVDGWNVMAAEHPLK
jgi:exo-1,4-beta-D-glucosaminidase